MIKKSLYDFPEIYDALRNPGHDVCKKVYRLMCEYLGYTPKSVMDPACGPATWLEYFAQQNILVAGNDLYPDMVKTARIKCGKQSLEFTTRDICDLDFKNGPFDVAFEMSGFLGVLPDESLEKFISQMANSIVKNGLLLITLFFSKDNTNNRKYPIKLYEDGPIQFGKSCQAKIIYEAIALSQMTNAEKIRRTVVMDGHFNDTGLIVDEYDIFFWTVERFTKFLEKFPMLEFLGSFNISNSGEIIKLDRPDNADETALILRKI